MSLGLYEVGAILWGVSILILLVLYAVRKDFRFWVVPFLLLLSGVGAVALPYLVITRTKVVAKTPDRIEELKKMAKPGKPFPADIPINSDNEKDYLEIREDREQNTVAKDSVQSDSADSDVWRSLDDSGPG